MILTLTLNPALDICGTANRLVADEKNYIRDEVHFPGGNGINVARVLTRLKVPVLATGFLGGSVGDEIRRLLDQECVVHDFVSISEATRLSITITQLKSHCQTRLSFSGPHISLLEKKKITSWMNRELDSHRILMIGGSLPKGFGVTHVRALIAAAKRRGLWVVLDVPSPILTASISAQPDLIKPNLVEFNELIGTQVRTIEEVVQAAQPLLRDVRWVCVSSVEGGAVLVTRQAAWFGRGGRIRARSTLGAGDSMVAGMLSQLMKYGPAETSQKRGDADWVERLCPDMLRWGIAAGMATAAHSTGRLSPASQVRAWVKAVRVRRLESSERRRSGTLRAS